MSQDYSRHSSSLVATPKATTLLSPTNFSTCFNSVKPHISLEPSQKTTSRSAQKRKKPNSSSHKSLQFSPSYQFLNSLVPTSTKRPATKSDKKEIGSYISSKPSNNILNINLLQQSPSFYSLSLSKNHSKYTDHESNLFSTKHESNSPVSRNALRRNKYLSTKESSSTNTKSSSFNLHKAEDRPRRCIDRAKGSFKSPKALPSRSINVQYQSFNSNDNSACRKQDETVPLIKWIMFPNNTPVTQEKISKKATPRNNMSPIIPNHNLKETLSYTLFEEESSNARQNKNYERDIEKIDAENKIPNETFHEQCFLQVLDENKILGEVTEDEREQEGSPSDRTSVGLNKSKESFSVSKRLQDKDELNFEFNMPVMMLNHLANANKRQLFDNSQHSLRIDPNLCLDALESFGNNQNQHNNVVFVEELGQSYGNLCNEIAVLETSRFNHCTHTTPVTANDGSQKVSGSTSPISKELLNGFYMEAKPNTEEKLADNITIPPSLSTTHTERRHISRSSATLGHLFLDEIINSQSKISNRNSTKHSNEKQISPSLRFTKIEKKFEVQPNPSKLKLKLGGIDRQKCQRAQEELPGSAFSSSSARNTRSKGNDSTKSPSRKTKKRREPLETNKDRTPTNLTAISGITGITARNCSPLSTDGKFDLEPIRERIKRQMAYNTSSPVKAHIKAQSLRFQEFQNRLPQALYQTQQWIQPTPKTKIHSYVLRRKAAPKTRSQDFNMESNSVGRTDMTKREWSARECHHPCNILDQSRDKQPRDIKVEEELGLNKEAQKLGSAQILDFETPTKQVSREIKQISFEHKDELRKSNHEHNELSSFRNISISRLLDESCYRTAKSEIQDHTNLLNLSSKEENQDEHGTHEIVNLSCHKKPKNEPQFIPNAGRKTLKTFTLDIKIDDPDSKFNFKEDEKTSPISSIRATGSSSQKKLLLIAKESKEWYYDRAFKNSLEEDSEMKLIFLNEFDGHKNTVTSIVKDSNKDIVYSSSKDGTIQSWDLPGSKVNLGGSVLCTEDANRNMLFKSKKAVECLLYDEANRQLFCGGADHDITVFDSTLEQKRKLKGHKGGVFGLSMIGRNSILSCSGDQTIKKWDIQRDECVETWTGHKNRITSVLYNRQKLAHTFVSCSVDGQIRMWDMRDSQPIVVFNDHQLDVTSLVYVNDQCNIASGSLDGTVKIWDLSTRTMIKSVDVGSKVHSIEYCERTGQIIVGADELQSINPWNSFEIRNFDTSDYHMEGSVRSLLLDKESGILYTGSFDTKIKAWLLRSDKCNQ